MLVVPTHWYQDDVESSIIKNIRSAYFFNSKSLSRSNSNDFKSHSVEGNILSINNNTRNGYCYTTFDNEEKINLKKNVPIVISQKKTICQLSKSIKIKVIQAIDVAKNYNDYCYFNEDKSSEVSANFDKCVDHKIRCRGCNDFVKRLVEILN